MCLYTRKVFACGHDVWGTKMKDCLLFPDPSPPPPSSSSSSPPRQYDDDDDVSQRALCVIRKSNGRHCRRLAAKCAKCQKLVDVLERTRETLQMCRELFVKEHPDYLFPEERAVLLESRMAEEMLDGHEKKIQYDNAPDVKEDPDHVSDDSQISQQGWIRSINGKVSPSTTFPSPAAAESAPGLPNAEKKIADDLEEEKQSADLVADLTDESSAFEDDPDDVADNAGAVEEQGWICSVDGEISPCARSSKEGSPFMRPIVEESGEVEDIYG